MDNNAELKLIAGLLAQDDTISLAIAFGSMAKGSAGTQSDIDIALKIVPSLSTAKKIKLIEAIAELLGRPVDLIDLQTVGEPLLGQILQYGTRLKGNDTKLAELALRHVCLCQ